MLPTHALTLILVMAISYAASEINEVLSGKASINELNNAIIAATKWKWVLNVAADFGRKEHQANDTELNLNITEQDTIVNGILERYDKVWKVWSPGTTAGATLHSRLLLGDLAEEPAVFKPENETRDITLTIERRGNGSGENVIHFMTAIDEILKNASNIPVPLHELLKQVNETVASLTEFPTENETSTPVRFASTNATSQPLNSNSKTILLEDEHTTAVPITNELHNIATAKTEHALFGITEEPLLNDFENQRTTIISLVNTEEPLRNNLPRTTVISLVNALDGEKQMTTLQDVSAVNQSDLIASMPLTHEDTTEVSQSSTMMAHFKDLSTTLSDAVPTTKSRLENMVTSNSTRSNALRDNNPTDLNDDKTFSSTDSTKILKDLTIDSAPFADENQTTNNTVAQSTATIPIGSAVSNVTNDGFSDVGSDAGSAKLDLLNVTTLSTTESFKSHHNSSTDLSIDVEEKLFNSTTEWSIPLDTLSSVSDELITNKVPSTNNQNKTTNNIANQSPTTIPWDSEINDGFSSDVEMNSTNSSTKFDILNISSSTTESSTRSHNLGDPEILFNSTTAFTLDTISSVSEKLIANEVPLENLNTPTSQFEELSTNSLESDHSRNLTVLNIGDHVTSAIRAESDATNSTQVTTDVNLTEDVSMLSFILNAKNINSSTTLSQDRNEDDIVTHPASDFPQFNNISTGRDENEFIRNPAPETNETNSFLANTTTEGTIGVSSTLHNPIDETSIPVTVPDIPTDPTTDHPIVATSTLNNTSNFTPTDSNTGKMLNTTSEHFQVYEVPLYELGNETSENVTNNATVAPNQSTSGISFNLTLSIENYTSVAPTGAETSTVKYQYFYTTPKTYFGHANESNITDSIYSTQNKTSNVHAQNSSSKSTGSIAVVRWDVPNSTIKGSNKTSHTKTEVHGTFKSSRKHGSKKSKTNRKGGGNLSLDQYMLELKAKLRRQGRKIDDDEDLPIDMFLLRNGIHYYNATTNDSTRNMTEDEASKYLYFEWDRRISNLTKENDVHLPWSTNASDVCEAAWQCNITRNERCISEGDRKICDCGRAFTRNTKSGVCETFLVNSSEPCAEKEMTYCSPRANCMEDSSKRSGYYCSCKKGYLDVSPVIALYPGEVCDESCMDYCENNGVCILKDGDILCSCPLGYSGYHCEFFMLRTSLLLTAGVLSASILCCILPAVLACCLRKCGRFHVSKPPFLTQSYSMRPVLNRSFFSA